jgi:anti-anti-sigma regulatory factor
MGIRMNVSRFLYDYMDSIVLDGQGVQPDPELAARNLVRAREVIKRMGEKWCLHNPNPPVDLAASSTVEQ